MSVREALDADLGRMPATVQDSALAAVARNLADVLDSGPGARDSASVAKELRAAMADLRTMADVAPEEADPIDELSRRKAARQSGTHLPQRPAGSGGRVG